MAFAGGTEPGHGTAPSPETASFQTPTSVIGEGSRGLAKITFSHINAELDKKEMRLFLYVSKGTFLCDFFLLGLRFLSSKMEVGERMQPIGPNSSRGKLSV